MENEPLQERIHLETQDTDMEDDISNNFLQM